MTVDVICPRCRVSVPADKIAIKDRCGDRDCPLSPRAAHSPTLAPIVAASLAFGIILVFAALKIGGFV